MARDYGKRMQQLEALLKRPQGITSEGIEKAFGFKPVSARALVAKIRKFHNVEGRRDNNGVTTYRLVSQ